MKNLCIITARGGSKRIPRKNIRDFCGKPIIAYSIEIALKSEIFDEVMVSTDDEEIAEIAIKYGAKVPFMRSKKNSDDYSGTADVLLEVLEGYQSKGHDAQYACCIYPTAPFISIDLLKESRSLLTDKNVDSVFPILQFSFPIQRALKKNQFGFVEMFSPENLTKRSQDLEPAYHDAGQFYFFNVHKFLETKKLWMERSSGIVLSELDAHDIDTEEDWKIAEFKYHYRNNKQ
jgi:pseudaminic acid cytidylyltransferase